jgi:hypothetical protein
MAFSPEPSLANNILGYLCLLTLVLSFLKIFRDSRGSIRGLVFRFLGLIIVGSIAIVPILGFLFLLSESGSYSSGIQLGGYPFQTRYVQWGSGMWMTCRCPCDGFPEIAYAELKVRLNFIFFIFSGFMFASGCATIKEVFFCWWSQNNKKIDAM